MLGKYEPRCCIKLCIKLCKLCIKLLKLVTGCVYLGRLMQVERKNWELLVQDNASTSQSLRAFN